MKNSLFFTLMSLTLLSSISATAAGPYRPPAKKILDGSILFCPPTENQKDSRIQLQTRVVDAVALEDVVQIDLQIKSVKCENRIWTINSNVHQNGPATMSDYELIAVDSNSKILFQTKLQDFENTGEEVVTIGLEKSSAERLDRGILEVFVRAKQTQNINSTHEKETFLTTFGSSHLLLK